MHLETLGAHLELHPREESRWLRTTQIQRTLPENPMSTLEKPKSIYHSLKAHFRTSKRGSHHPSSTKNNSKRLLQGLHKGIKKLPRQQQISKPILDLFYLHHKATKHIPKLKFFAFTNSYFASQNTHNQQPKFYKHK